MMFGRTDTISYFRKTCLSISSLEAADMVRFCVGGNNPTSNPFVALLEEGSVNFSKIKKQENVC